MKRIYLLGFMGAGKSTIGESLANKIGYQFVDTDQLIEEKTGNTISDIFKLEGEEKFREYEKEILLNISKTDNIVVATGGGTPCYKDNLSLIKKSGFSIYLKQPALLLYYRLRETQYNRPLIADIQGNELYKYVSTTLKHRKPYYTQADLIAQYNSSSIERIIEKLVVMLYKSDLRISPPTTSSNAE